MKATWWAWTVVAMAVAGAAWAAEEGGGPAPVGTEAPAGVREHMRRIFDTNGDGQLTGEELEKAKAAMEKMKERADTNGDGQVSDEERKAVMEKLRGARDEIVKKYDKDGDGKLNEEEREAARQAARESMEKGELPGTPAADGDHPARLSREGMLKKFDKDGDGQLSESERQAMREDFMKRRDGQGGDRPRRGDGEGRGARSVGGAQTI